ncbi:hypothetical protein G6F31_020129 [Rhizopus arrhizus]|nr:hypothetical protein G6F31_020129 [Rhizopus arrhizus]
MAHARHAAPDVGQHVDDGPAVLAHVLGIDLARHQEGAVQVVLDHGVPAVETDAVQRRRKLPARAIEQAVDAAMPGQHVRDHAAHAGLVSDIARVQADAPGGFGRPRPLPPPVTRMVLPSYSPGRNTDA